MAVGSSPYGLPSRGVVKLVKLPAFRPYTRARAQPRPYGANVSKFTNFTTRCRMEHQPARDRRQPARHAVP
jgi:hypothetical protein